MGILRELIQTEVIDMFVERELSRDLGQDHIRVGGHFEADHSPGLAAGAEPDHRPPVLAGEDGDVVPGGHEELGAAEFGDDEPPVDDGASAHVMTIDKKASLPWPCA